MTRGDDRTRPTRAVYVGYTMRLKPGVEINLPEFRVPSNYQDAARIAQYREEKKQAFLADARNMPYTGTFDEVFLIDPNARDEQHPEARTVKALQYRSHPPEAGKPPVAVRVRNYLIKHYPTAWSNDTLGRGRPELLVVGFDPRFFLKILGLECSLPGVGEPCPLGMWYSNADYRDIGEAACPKEFPWLTLPYVLRFRRPVDPEDAETWDGYVKGWTGPGTNPGQDARIAFALATQLGFERDE